MNRNRWVILAGLALLAGCSTSPPAPWACSDGTVFVDAAFDGGNLDGCAVSADGQLVLKITPEDPPPINPSPWYAFRVVGPEGSTARVTLQFVDGPARYWPKISRDARNWRRMDPAQVVVDKTDATIDLQVTANPQGTFVAGQEIHDTDFWIRWRERLRAHPALSLHVAGQSRDGRPIVVLDSGPGPSEFVMLIGRQHPPEITGTLAMQSFVDTLLGESALAQRFRDRYRLVIAPWINPDGVEAGHWRHNHGGVDLNRDWGPFTQPETRAIRDYVDTIVAGGARPALMLDFHSTSRDLFYTQVPEDFPGQPDFATEWFARVRTVVPDYSFDHEPRPGNERPTTKTYFFTTYGIPAITYELGDETDRALIARVTPVFAAELMALMLGE